MSKPEHLFKHLKKSWVKRYYSFKNYEILHVIFYHLIDFKGKKKDIVVKKKTRSWYYIFYPFSVSWQEGKLVMVLTMEAKKERCVKTIVLLPLWT